MTKSEWGILSLSIGEAHVWVTMNIAAKDLKLGEEALIERHFRPAIHQLLLELEEMKRPGYVPNWGPTRPA